MRPLYISKLIIPIVLLLGWNCAIAQTTFSTAGGPYGYTVPTGVTQLGFDLAGAQGGSYSGATGGLGGRVQGTLTVTPNSVLYIYVGGQPSSSSSSAGVNGGGSGNNGSGGGGGTDIRTTSGVLSSRLVVGGGGGGSTYYCYQVSGGTGGYPNGGAGVPDNCWGSCYAGNGASTSSGGSGAACGCGGTGSIGVGGNGGCGYAGGGGGGYYGGGGGYYGPGGGGSSWASPTSTSGVTYTNGYETSNGYVTIYGPTLTVSPASLNFNTITAGTTSIAQFFQMSGTYMPVGQTITLTPPTDYEISTNGLTWYTSGHPMSYPVPGSTMVGAQNQIYVKFIAPTLQGNYCENITITGGGITGSILVPVCGNSAANCAGAVSAGTSVANPTVGGTLTGFNLSLTGLPTSGGLTYQWQSSTTGNPGTFTNIPNAIQSTYSFTGITTNMYYQCIVTCPASNSSAVYSGANITFQGPATGYCIPGSQYLSCNQAAVGSAAYPFVLTGINGTAINDNYSCGLAAYTDRTTSGQTCTMAQGQTYGGSYTTCNVSTPVFAYQSVQIWIDFNNDGQFQSTESVGGIGNFYNTVVHPTIAIPTTVASGLYRMRIQVTFSNNNPPGNSSYPDYPQQDPCTATLPQYAETRDYMVTIGSGPCQGTPSAGISDISASVGCVGFVTNLYDIGSTNATGITYQWQQSATGGAGTFFNCSGASTSPIYSPTVASTAYYQCVVTCSTSSLHATSSPELVTLNLPPAPITGSNVICNFTTATLASSPTGGTWSSSSPTTVAAAGSVSSNITGVSVGQATITYTLPTTCYATYNVTVNQAPKVINGTEVVCAGGSTTLTDSIGGGIWSSSTPSVIPSVGSSSGVVTATGSVPGVVTGTVNYTLPDGCLTSATITVNPNPGLFIEQVAPGGSASYCAGSPSTADIELQGSIPGITYQLQLAGSGITSLSGSGALLNFGVQTATGVYKIVATNNTTNCVATMAGAVTVNVSPAPIAYPISVTNGGVYCAGATLSAPHIILGGSQSGVTYQVFSGPTPIGLPATGTGASIDLGAQTAPGSYTVVGTSTAGGCTTNMSGSAIIIVNPLPTPYTVLGGGTFCAGGTGVDISLSYSNVGISYQLVNGTTVVGGAVAGTGTPLDFGLQTANGSYSIVATNTSSGCINNMSGNPSVFMYPLPNAYNVTQSGSSFCAGGLGIDIGVNPSDAGVNYQLMLGTTPIGSPQTGTGLNVDLFHQTTVGTYTVIATDPSTGCSNTMLGSATVTVNALPTSYNVTGGGNFCTGGTGVPVGLSSSAAGVSYQLFTNSVAGPTMTGTGSALSFGNQTTTGNYTIVATNSNNCSSTMTGAASVGLNLLPTQFSVTGSGTYCAGGTGVDVGLGFSQTGVKYQLYNTGGPVGSPVSGTGTPLDFGMQTNPGTYTVVATNTSTACVNNMSGSAVISSNPLPANHLVTGGGSYCAGGTGKDVSLSSSDTGISYQLYLGLTPVAGVPAMTGTGSSLDFGDQLLPGTYTVYATNNTTGCAKNMIGGASVIVNSLPAPFAVSGGGIYCSGGGGVHVGLSGSATGIKYQLWNGATPVGPVYTGTGGIIDFGAQLASGTYTVQATANSSGCQNNMTGSATIATYPAPVAYPVTGGGSYCAGGGGVDVGLGNSDVSVNYQLMMGTSIVGGVVSGTGAALDFGNQTNVGTYTVVATNATTGCAKTMASDAVIAINPLPAAYAVSGGGNYCAGGTGVHVFQNLSAPGVNYQLFNGVTPGAVMAGTGAGLDFGLQTSSGTYTVVATNPTTTCSNNMTGSAIININPLPATYNVSGGGSYCTGGTGVAIGLSNSDAGIKYQLLYGLGSAGAAVNGTGSAITFGTHTATGSYSVVAINSATGCSSNMAGTANISINTPPTIYSVTGGGTYCATGTGLNVGISSSDLNVNYQLYDGSTPAGIALPGTGGPIDFGRETATGIYTAVATDAVTGCMSNMGGSAVININPVVLPHVAVTPSIAGTVCTGQSVTFSASPVNGGTAPTFQWMVNGVSAGVGTTFTYEPLNNDVVTATIHSNEICAIPDTGSTSMTITVSPQEMPSVNVAVSPGTLVCTGSPVSFTATPMYGGTSPVLVWLKNGVPAATGTTYSYTPSNGDIVTFLLGSNFNCRLQDTVFSAPSTIDVQNPVIPTVAVSANTGANISAQQSVTFTATVTHGGPAVAYQWVVNSTIIPGATNATYTTSTLANNDSVSCQVTGACDMIGFNEIVMKVSTTGVTQIANGSDVVLVPNPNKGEFTVKGNLGTTIDQEASLEITDMLGQVIYTGKVVAPNGNINEHIKLNGSLANGMYLLNIRSGSESTIFHFVIEQ